MSRTSVVIITRDRCPALLATLARLTTLPEQPPIVVVDNGSRDGSPDAVRGRFPAVRVLALAENLGAAGRTVGVHATQTPYVAFADDDSWWAPGSLAAAADVLDAHPRLALLGARVLVEPGGRLDPVCAAMATSPLPPAPDLPGPPVLGFVACGAVVRRTAYLAAGGFDRRFGVGGEEAVLACDLDTLGWGLAYVDRVVAHHEPSPVRDLAARRRREVRNALWAAWLRRRWPAVARETRRTLARIGEPAVRGGLLDAVRGLAWVVRERRPVRTDLERRLRLLDA